MMHQSTDELLENEWYIVRNSGEIPEIAFNSALYFLTKAQDGPQMDLTAKQLAWLKDGAVERFREIILRDLQHTNIEKTLYRGWPGRSPITRGILHFAVDRISLKRQSRGKQRNIL